MEFTEIIKFFLLYFLLWAGMIPVAIGNGVLREKFLNIHLREITAHQISTLTLIVLFTVYVFTVLSIFPLNSLKSSLIIGFTWSVLTIVFEFAFGRIAAGFSWRQMLSDYNILSGRIWILIPLSLLLLPVLFHIMK